jgi:hypothetical protein
MFIDYSSRAPLDQFAKTASHLSNYRRVYSKSESGVPRETGEAALARYLATYDELGAEHVVIKARDLETTFGFKIANEDIAAFCKAHGPRFIGFAGVDPHKGMIAVRELEYAVRELGLRGLNLQCFEHKLPPNDKRMYPLYAKCIELGIPVNIHCGINFSTDSLMEYGRPTHLDEVMVHFPELRVCASPPGWPWIHELIGVAWRHSNLSIGLVSVRPKLLVKAQSGYEPLLQYGGATLQDQIIFGSGYPMMAVERSLAEVRALPLEEAVKQKWLYANAARFLGLAAAPG